VNVVEQMFYCLPSQCTRNVGYQVKR